MDIRTLSDPTMERIMARIVGDVIPLIDDPAERHVVQKAIRFGGVTAAGLIELDGTFALEVRVDGEPLARFDPATVGLHLVGGNVVELDGTV